MPPVALTEERKHEIYHFKQLRWSDISHMLAYDYSKAKYEEIKHYVKQFSSSRHDILFQGYFRPGDNLGLYSLHTTVFRPPTLVLPVHYFTATNTEERLATFSNRLYTAVSILL